MGGIPLNLLPWSTMDDDPDDYPVVAWTTEFLQKALLRLVTLLSAPSINIINCSSPKAELFKKLKPDSTKQVKWTFLYLLQKASKNKQRSFSLIIIAPHQASSVPQLKYIRGKKDLHPIALQAAGFLDVVNVRILDALDVNGIKFSDTIDEETHGTGSVGSQVLIALSFFQFMKALLQMDEPLNGDDASVRKVFDAISSTVDLDSLKELNSLLRTDLKR